MKKIFKKSKSLKDLFHANWNLVGIDNETEGIISYLYEKEGFNKIKIINYKVL